MEINLENLAMLQKPQMMPQTSTSSMGSVGGDAVRGAMFGQDQARFDDTLNQIAPIAQAQGQSQMQDLQGKMQMQPMEQAAKIKKMQLEALTPYASAWDAAKTQGEKDQIWDEIANDPSIPKQKDWKNMPPDVREKYMSMTRAMAVNTPQHAQQQDLWGTRMQGAATVAGIKGDTTIQATGMKTDSAERIAQINNAAKMQFLETAQKGKEALVKNEEDIMRKIRNGTATPTDRAVLGMIQTNHIAAAALMAGTKPPNVDVKTVTQGKVPMLPTPTPQLAPIPENAPTTVNKQALPNYKPGDVWQDTKGKSKIVRTGKDSKGNIKLQLEDGRIVDGQ